MVPIHDTDLAEERWSKAEWERFELWEKIEQRMRRRRMRWNIVVAFLFLAVSAVPAVMDRWPLWEARWLSGKLAQQLGAVKREAALQHQAVRIRFDGGGKLTYTVERAASCAEPRGTPIRTGSLASVSQLERYGVVEPARGSSEGIPGLVESYCYDPLRGADGALAGIAIAPVNDLASGRKDRIAVLLISGTTGALSFD